MSIQDRTGKEPSRREYRHPVDRVIEESGLSLYRISEVADMLGKPASSIRAATKGNRVKAPSKIYTSGKMLVYLYTEDDIDELRDYLS